MKIGLSALLILGAAGEAHAGICSEELVVLSSSATYKTRMFQGKPLRRDAVIDGSRHHIIVLLDPAEWDSALIRQFDPDRFARPAKTGHHGADRDL